MAKAQRKKFQVDWEPLIEDIKKDETGELLRRIIEKLDRKYILSQLSSAEIEEELRRRSK